jgi:glycosyltransferase involved in cell wall biosynthesis
MITVLFVSPSRGLSGDTLSLGDMIAALGDQIKPIILLTEKDTPAYYFFSSRGIECLVHPYLNALKLPLRDNIRIVLTKPWRMLVVKRLRFDVPCVKFVIKTLSNRKIDIVHTNTAPTLIGHDLAKSLEARHVWHVREFVDFLHVGAIPIKRLNKMINCADARIVVSEACRSHWFLKNEKTWTILDAVRSVKDSLFDRSKLPYILFCSNWITEAKGAAKAIVAFGKSRVFSFSSKEYPIRLKFVGNCDEYYKEYLLELAYAYGCAGFIDFIPAQKDVKMFFVQAMAYLNCSVNEGMGRTTAEAMFYGCPIVALASGGTLDLVKHGETGWLFNTVEECTELLKMVCQTNQEQIILQAQEFAKQNLSNEIYGAKIMEVYKSVL